MTSAALLPEAPKPEPAAMRALRARAHEQLEREGLPTKKTEAWRFTNVSGLVRDLGDAALTPGASTMELGALPSGVTRVAAPGELEALATAGAFTALNAALAEDTVVLRAEGAVADALELRYRGADHASYPRLRIEVAQGSELTVVERFEGKGAFTDAVLELDLAAGARVRHVRIQREEGRLVGLVAVRQARDSFYGAHVVTLGGELQRLDVRVGLDGPGAECDLRGAYLVDGSEQVDHHIRVDHRAPHGTSHQTFRGIADGKGTAVFDSQAIVHRSGPHAEAHQKNENLLMSEGAVVHTKPHLEIDHDEVVASHGATVGALDDDSLFYLRSRGIPASLARGILVDAFVRAPLEGLPSRVAAEVSDALLERLPASDLLRSLHEPEDA